MALPERYSRYSVLYVPEGKGTYVADFGTFPFEGPTLLFSTPMQQISLQANDAINYTMIQFHGDFYCIEYHKAQVSCNGLLFNNIYIEPSVKLTAYECGLFGYLLEQIEKECNEAVADEVVLRSYLQLFLAKSSSIKIRTMTSSQYQLEKDEQMERFKELLEEHYLDLHKPNDYARLLAMTPNNFTKRCTRYFKKAPSAIIQERLILEAKKKLHLTRQSIKEIAYALNFSDEYYFSRFFKKFTKVSPQAFRDHTGISLVADI